MSKRVLTVVLMMIPLAILAFAALPAQGKERVSEAALQTWPSRTPPPDGDPTSTPPPTDDGGGNGNGDDSTATPVPSGNGQSTATTEAGVTSLAETPEGGYLATAEPCSMSPTIQTRGQVNVREGPGVDYPTVSQLVYLEVRPIIGRAAYSPWWLVQLVDGSQGWVADQAVTVQGYTGAVPFAEAPPIDGNTPTPGAPWNPTPNPICTPEPTATPTRTPTASTVSAILPASPSPRPPTNTPAPAASATPAPVTETPIPPTATSAMTATPLPTAIPLEAASEANGAGSMILYAGIGLLVIGAVAAALRLRSRPTEDS